LRAEAAGKRLPFHSQEKTMSREYATLSLSALPAGVRLADLAPPAHVTLDDPAIEVMTDLREYRAATIGPERTIDEAHAVMLGRGVRLLFVLDDNRTVAGVITMTDLLGEKPMHFIQERGVKRSDVLVSDMMTPASDLEAVTMADVARMRVGHVVATLTAVRRQHILASEDGGRRIGGVFSTQRIARQLGLDLDTFAVARSFAEIRSALSR
jgi:CBS domain-containing protein